MRCFATGFLLWATLASAPGATTRVRNEAQAEALFSGREIPRLVIEISDDEMELLRGQKRQGNRGPARSNVWATVRENGRLHTNVALHLKGSGSFRTVDQKPSFTLSFDKVDEDQRFHGLQKISLNNTVQDPTFLCEILGRGLYAEAGIPVPRATHATVELNGRELGLYVLLEGWNKQFLKSHFRDAGGNLYERTSGARDVTMNLEVKSGDQPADRRALEALAAAITEPDLEKRWRALHRTLDVDRFITGLALEIMIGHWDGYARNQNNFRIFHDRAQDRLVFLPHGMDQLFGLRRKPPDLAPIGPTRGLVAALVMESPEGRASYLKRMEELHARVFSVTTLTGRVHELSARLRPWLAGSPDVLDNHEKAVAQLLERLPARHEYVGRELVVLRTPWRPGGHELEDSQRWDSRRDAGNPDMTRTSSLLKVSGRSTPTCVGSWRTLLLLEPGRYRFEGKVSVEAAGNRRTRPQGLASLRSSEGDAGHGAELPQTWTNLIHEFSVTTPHHVELICEYHGSSGTALFEAGSLKLTRLGDPLPPARNGKPPKVEDAADVPKRRL